MIDPLGTARLMELAEQKLHLLTQLRELSLTQNQLAEERSSDELLSLLSRKSQAIEALQKIQHALVPFQSQEPDSRIWGSESERQRCRALFDQSEQRIAEILVIDNQTLSEMNQQRELIGQQLSQFASAEAIHDAYNGFHQANDVQSEPSFTLDG
jgi:hypothetical protein